MIQIILYLIRKARSAAKWTITLLTTDPVPIRPGIIVFGSIIWCSVVVLLDAEASTLEGAMVLSATITTISAVIALPRRYTRDWYLIAYIYTTFIAVTFLYVKSDNLLNFFSLYELFLIPSAIIVWIYSPNYRGIKSTIIFLVWTQLGSLMVLIAILYLKYTYNIVSFTDCATAAVQIPLPIQLLLVTGFLFKIPTFPFYYWLTKVHVEAPTSFSIFLSGFLVKIAIFGLYKFMPYLGALAINLAILSSLMGAAVSSIMFLHQIDLKKLVAYATIQEMGAFASFLFITQNSNIEALSIFLITHTALSAYYFYVTEVLYKRAGTRSFIGLFGLIYAGPKVAGYTAISVLLFRGLPYTSKFMAEASLVDALSIMNPTLLVYVAVTIFFIGNLMFALKIKSILTYGPHNQGKICNPTYLEVILFWFILITLIIVPFIVI